MQITLTVSSVDRQPGHLTSGNGYYLGLLDFLSYAGQFWLHTWHFLDCVSLPEAMIIFQWGLSDKLERKPILLACTLHLTATLMGQGFATAYSQLGALRLSEGLFNVNLGAVNAIYAELTGADEIQLA